MFYVEDVELLGTLATICMDEVAFSTSVQVSSKAIRVDVEPDLEHLLSLTELVVSTFVRSVRS